MANVDAIETVLSQFTITIITFVVLMFVSYVVISLVVHKGLKKLITSSEIRNGIVGVMSVIVFCLIGLAVFVGKWRLC